MEEEKKSKWFEGKWIVIRGKENCEDDMYWELIFLPVNGLHQCFIQQQTLTNYNNNSEMKKINHSLHHTSPFHFALPQITIMELFKGVYEATWVVLGSLIYFFGALGETGTTNEIYYLPRNLDGTFPPSMVATEAGCMVSGRRQPKVVALDKKVYIFGGNDSKDVFGEVFEPSPDSHKGQSRPLSSPTPSSYTPCDVIFAVAIEKESKIVVGLNYKNLDVEETHCELRTVFFVYDVGNDSWVKHNIKFCFNLRSPLCQPIAVDSCLYWLDTKNLRVYDLNTRQRYKGPIEDGLFQHILETPCDLQVSLVHLAGDKFCMTWVDCHDPTVVHYTTLLVFRTTTKIHGKCFNLRATVFSCESFASKLALNLRDRALVL